VLREFKLISTSPFPGSNHAETNPSVQACPSPAHLLLAVTSVQHVQQIIQNTPVGQSVPITFRRGERVLSTVVVVGDGRVLRPLMLQQQ